MAEILTYDPSNDPQAVEAREAAEQESLSVAEDLEAQQEEMLAGKYKNAQELEKAYLELQKKLGEDTDTDEDLGEESEEYEETEDESESDPQADVLWKANDEFYETGEISEETLEEFSKMSSKELVEAYMRIQQENPDIGKANQSVELSEAEVNQVKNNIGGEAEYQKLMEWAGSNLSEKEILAYDNVIESGNLQAIGFAVQALQSKYRDNMGYEGEMLTGKSARSNDTFRSQAELVRAMSDPRYDRDPAYRQDVIDKLERSDLDF